MTDSKISALRNCKKCNRVFSSVDGGALCSRCNEDADDGFTKVRVYIYDNPTSSVKEVSVGTGVPSDVILKWIRDGKIQLTKDSSIAFCERCSEPTEGTRFCPVCIRDLSTGLKSGLEERATQKNHVGMHIKDKDKDFRKK